MREFLSTLPQVIGAKAGPRSVSHSVRQIDTTRRLFDAVRDRRAVEMTYFSAAANRVKPYAVQPYRLTLAQGGLYLVAWVPAYDEFRTFATERIERLTVTDETFKRTRELPATLFGTSMGVFTGEPERIEITFAPRLAIVVRSRIWHDSQELTDLPDGGVRMTLLVSNDWALRSWLLGFGAAARVVTPAALARSIADECRQMAATYDDLD
jgi:predicted DNA-binding transcriptional regulator YafY